MNKDTSFRTWLRNIWYDNCDEHLAHGELPYSMQEYFQKYKYWLKREYQYQRKMEQKEPKTNRIAALIDPNFVVNGFLGDKLDYTGARLMSKSQDKFIKTLKDKNEK